MKSFKKLYDFAKINTGVYASSMPVGDLIYLQTKHFDNNAQLQEKPFHDLVFEERLAKHLLTAGDIVFAAKGTKNFAWVYKEEIGKAVASSSFFVIKIAKNVQQQLLPDYLAWYINHPRILADLKKQAAGTSMPSITKDVLSDILIAIPSLQKQKQVVEVHQLAQKQNQLYHKLQQLNETYIQNLLFNNLS